MCLKTKNPKPLIADKDIVCYKIFYRSFIPNTLLTAFQGMEMQIGSTYSHFEQVPAYFGNGYYYVEEGYYHSFRSIKTIPNSIYRTHVRNLGVVVKCVIPKGSTYYIGMFDGDEYNSYASDSIKLIKEVKLNWFTKLYYKIFDKC